MVCSYSTVMAPPSAPCGLSRSICTSSQQLARGSAPRAMHVARCSGAAQRRPAAGCLRSQLRSAAPGRVPGCGCQHHSATAQLCAVPTPTANTLASCWAAGPLLGGRRPHAAQQPSRTASSQQRAASEQPAARRRRPQQGPAAASRQGGTTIVEISTAAVMSQQPAGGRPRPSGARMSPSF
jgi:hypothetical protein